MTIFLRIYDNVSSRPSTSLAITLASTSYSFFQVYRFGKILDPLSFLVSAFAGSTLAIFAKVILAHHTEVRAQCERNTIYSTLAIVATSLHWNKTLTFARTNNLARQFFSNFRGFLFPHNFLNGLGAGFLVTTLVQHIQDQKKSYNKNI